MFDWKSDWNVEILVKTVFYPNLNKDYVVAEFWVFCQVFCQILNVCFCTCTHSTVHTLSLHPSIRSIVSEIWLSGLDSLINFQIFCLPIFYLFVYLFWFSFYRKNQQFPNLNPQMVTLAYQRAVPATLLTQWTLATI